MRTAIIQSTLVALIGMYAVRASWFLFGGQLTALTPVAAAVFVLCLVLFHWAPTMAGPWLYVLLAACVAGAAVNASLLFSAEGAYRDPTNFAFSAASVVGWIVLLAGYGWVLIESPAARG
jgi:hypothetical protein